MSDPNRVAGGLKATLHNPKASEETKERAAEKLQNMGESNDSTYEPGASEDSFEREVSENYERDVPADSESGEHHNRVMGGYKATLKNPNTSEEAKQHAKEVLEGDN